jgi:hypothetical protein
MPWYEYISNAYIADLISLLWTNYSIAIGIVSGLIGIIVKHTKTKRDDKVWADIKRLVLARRKEKASK